jgi:iron complex transport system ATP-binding protein
VEHIAVSYGARRAVNGIDLDLQASDLAGVIGPNGSGKSTLLKAITRIVPLDSGRIEIEGRDIRGLSRREIAQRVAVVPQTPALPEAFTALDVVMLGRTPHLRLLESESGRDYEIVREAMEQAECWQIAGRRMGELSGGEAQRVVLARALAQQTPILLLDEPTAHLDIAHQTKTFGLIQRLCRESQLAALAVVHDLTLAGLYCDRLLLMKDGREIASGEPHDVLTPVNIQQAYGAAVRVTAHPQSGRPVVIPEVTAFPGGDVPSSPVFPAPPSGRDG